MSNNQNNNPIHQVSLSQRYSSAWSEINTRIQARQTVQLTFVTISITFICFVFSKNIDSPELGFLLPMLSIPFSLWVVHNDFIIGLLSKFCSHCESFNKSDHSLPCWHSLEQGWITTALDYRKLTDYSFIISLAITILPTLYFVLKNSNNNFLSGVLYTLVGLLGPISAIIVYLNSVRRKKILENLDLTNSAGKLALIIKQKTDKD